MQLRDHPLMCYRGVCNWPPTWVSKEKTHALTGEVGTLRYVFASNQVQDKCFLVIDFENQSYIGTLMFDHPSFCVRIVHVLRSHTGRSIKEIGDLEIV